MVLAVQKGLNVSCLIEKATTILGNSAGGVTRQRHCQPNLPPTPDQNTWAPGAAMASLWATTLVFFFWIPLSRIPTLLRNSLLRLEFPHFVSEKISLDLFSHGWILQEKKKIHLQDMQNLTALPVAPRSTTRRSGLQQGWAPASSPSPHSQ